MTKPPTSVRSIRLTDDLWAALQARADLVGMKLNGYVADRLSMCVEEAEAGPQPLTNAQMKHVLDVMTPGRKVRVVDDGAVDFVPLISRPQFNPQPKPGTKKR